MKLKGGSKRTQKSAGRRQEPTPQREEEATSALRLVAATKERPLGRVLSGPDLLALQATHGNEVARAAVERESPARRKRQKEIVRRLLGLENGRARRPTDQETKRANDEARKQTGYTGPDIELQEIWARGS
jgi:hypothetical protein